jgi:8-oxo-dGTP diphosphatase
MPASDQGVDRERYMLVPRTLIFIVRWTFVLLLRGSKEKRLWSDLYNGIGGHVEKGEDILSAARRELQEEAGLECNNLFLCGIVTVDTLTNPGVGIYIFKGETSQVEIMESKEGKLEWIEYANIYKIPLVADLPMILPKVIELKNGDVPFSAHTMYDENGQMKVYFGR